MDKKKIYYSRLVAILVLISLIFSAGIDTLVSAVEVETTVKINNPKRVTSNNNLSIPIAEESNFIVVSLTNNSYFVWTMEDINSRAKVDLVAAIKNSPDIKGGYGNNMQYDISGEGNVKFFHGNRNVEGVEVKVDKESGDIKLQFTATSQWRHFVHGNFTYTPLKTSENFKVKKHLSGKELEEAEFSFELYEIIGEVREFVSSATNKANGDIVFPKINYVKAGTHNYIITEVNDGKDGYKYDNMVIKITVTVEDDNGQLYAKASYPEDTTFNNSYEAEPVDNPGDGSGEDPKEEPGDGSGENPGDNTGEEPKDNEPGNPKEPEETPGEGTGNESEEKPEDKPIEEKDKEKDKDADKVEEKEKIPEKTEQVKEDSKNSAVEASKNPKTSDGFNAALYGLLLIGSAVVMIVIKKKSVIS